MSYAVNLEKGLNQFKIQPMLLFFWRIHYTLQILLCLFCFRICLVRLNSSKNNIIVPWQNSANDDNCHQARPSKSHPD